MSTKKQFFGTTGPLTGEVGSFEERQEEKKKINQPGSILVICPSTEMVEFIPEVNFFEFFGDKAEHFPEKISYVECKGSCPVCGLFFEEDKNPPKIL